MITQRSQRIIQIFKAFPTGNYPIYLGFWELKIILQPVCYIYKIKIIWCQAIIIVKQILSKMVARLLNWTLQVVTQLGKILRLKFWVKGVISYN